MADLYGRSHLKDTDLTSEEYGFVLDPATAELGGHPSYFGPGKAQLGKKESTADTARVFGRMFDGIEFRGSAQADVEVLAARSGVPVWNGLTDSSHPSQILADLLTTPPAP